MATSFLSIILTVSFVLRVTDGQALGFVLNGVNYPNRSTVLRTDIGEGDAALQCTTDSTTCCSNQLGETRAGEFYFPNGSMVLNSVSAPSNSYYRTRSSRLIGLNRRPAATQTGHFRCEIPDASGTTVNLFINIQNELPTTLPTPPPVTSPPATRTTTATLPVTTTKTAASTTAQPGPVSISVSITASGTNTAGETYSLECSATVTGSTDQPTITWLDPMNNPVPSEMVTTTLGSMSTLTFNPLAASHAGTYTCRVTKGVLPPTSVTVTNGSVNVGSTVTLTCTVELSPAVDVPVTINTEWTGPDGFMTTNTAQPVMGSTITYTSTAMVSSFGRDQSGNYTCTATVRPNPTSTYLTGSGVLSNITFIVAPAAPPLNVQATQSSASAPVEVSWSPPSSRATNITGYRIFYGNGENVSVPSFVTRIILALNKDSVGETVSVRSEADQLASQLITVTVTTPTEAITKSSRSSALDVGVTFGVTFLIVCLVAIVIDVVFVYLWRSRRVGKINLDQSKNMPTQLYEDPDKLTSRGQGNYELTHCPAYESTTTKPEPPPRTQAEVDQSSHYEL